MIVELRQYTVHPDRRDELIDLFDREFVESQEKLGMTVLGQFRDLDRPDRFLWLRGFPDMTVRRNALTDFYSGPVWSKHGPAANATMIDWDDVLLLRAIVAPPQHPRDPSRPKPEVHATIWYRDHPFDTAFEQWFAALHSGAAAVLSTEYATNDFPALQVREGEHAFAWFTTHPAAAHIKPPPGITRTDHLHLAPTPRSAFP